MAQRRFHHKNRQEWMRTRTRKATLTLDDLDFIETMDLDFIETMGDAFKTYSPRAPAELSYIVDIGDSLLSWVGVAKFGPWAI